MFVHSILSRYVLRTPAGMMYVFVLVFSCEYWSLLHSIFLDDKIYTFTLTVSQVYILSDVTVKITIDEEFKYSKILGSC